MEILLSGLKFFYTDAGRSNAPVIVFIHGFPFDHTMWMQQAALFEPHFRVITYDQRSHGLTEVDDGPYLFESFVDDLFALLDALKVDQAFLCGLSMGGYVALRAAERRPERVNGLILCDTRSEADSNEAKLKRAETVKTIQEKGVTAFSEGFLKGAFAASSFTEHSSAVESIRRVIEKTPAKSLCAALVALATRTDTTQSLSRIRVPTLILVGEADALTPPSAAQSLHEHIPGSKLLSLPKAGHLSNLENPDAFNRALLQFLLPSLL